MDSRLRWPVSATLTLAVVLAIAAALALGIATTRAAPEGRAPAGAGSELPDLTIQFLQVTIETGSDCSFSSTELGVRIYFQNVGDTDAGPFDVEVNGVTQRVDGLAAGAKGSLWFPGYVHSDTNVGIVDVNAEVAESDEANNYLEGLLPIPTLPATCTATPSVTPPPTGTPDALPDLTIQYLQVTLETGNSCNFTSTNLGIRIYFANIGDADAGTFDVEVNGVVKTFAEGLAAGGKGSVWFPGYVYLGSNVGTVDIGNDVVESDETNNHFDGVLAVPTLPPTCTPTPSATPTPTRTPEHVGALGDANCDGAITSVDALFVLQLSAGLRSELPCGAAGDVNGDVEVTPVDATLILQVVAGLIAGF